MVKNMHPPEDNALPKHITRSYIAILALLSIAVYAVMNSAVIAYAGSLHLLLLTILFHPKLRRMRFFIPIATLLLIAMAAPFTNAIKPVSWGKSLPDQDIWESARILPSTDDLVRFTDREGIKAVRPDGSVVWEWKSWANVLNTWVQGSYTIVTGDDAYVVINHEGEARSQLLGEGEHVVALGPNVVVIYKSGSGSRNTWTAYSYDDGSVVWKLKTDESRIVTDPDEPSSIFATDSIHGQTLRSIDTGEVIGKGNFVWKSGDYGLIQSATADGSCIGTTVHRSDVLASTPITCDQIRMIEYGSVMIFESRSTYYSFDLRHAKISTVDCPDDNECFGLLTAVFDDVIVTNPPEGPMVAYDLYTGTELWRRTEARSDRTFAGNAVLVIERANVLLGPAPGQLAILDPRTGEPFSVLNDVMSFQVAGGNWLVANAWQSGFRTDYRLVEIPDTNWFLNGLASTIQHDGHPNICTRLPCEGDCDMRLKVIATVSVPNFDQSTETVITVPLRPRLEI